MSKKKNEEWDAKYCMISAKREPDGFILDYEGTYGNALAHSRFCIRRQSSGEYLMRGRLSIRSARDSARVLSNASGTPLAADIRIKTDSMEAAKFLIARAFFRLYVENLGVIYSDLSSARADDLSLLSVVTLFGKEYLIRDRKLSDRSIPRRLKNMERIAFGLEDYVINSISQAALTRVCKPAEAGAAMKTAINDLGRFIAYLQNKSVYFGDNPFVKFLTDHPDIGKKSTDQLIRAADRVKTLMDGVMKRLDELILAAAPDNARMTGLMLLRDAGVNNDIVMGLTWNDIIFDEICPGSCQIRIWLDRAGAATHNYTKPVFPFTAQELRRRYLSLLVRDPDIGNKRILDGVSKKQFVAFCRQILMLAREDYDTILSARTPGTGGGVQLLRSNYENRLRHYCGMWRASECDYMMMRRLNNDVTVDNYASLSSPYGQMRLHLLLCRDQHYALPPASTRMLLQRDSGPDGPQASVTIPANAKAHTTKVEVNVHMRPGQVFSAGAMGGLLIRTVVGVPEYEEGEAAGEDEEADG